MWFLIVQDLYNATVSLLHFLLFTYLNFEEMNPIYNSYIRQFHL